MLIMLKPKNGKYRLVDSDGQETFVQIRNNSKSFTVKLIGATPDSPSLEMCEFLYNSGEVVISYEMPYYAIKWWSDEEFMVFLDGAPPCHFEKLN